MQYEPLALAGELLWGQREQNRVGKQGLVVPCFLIWHADSVRTQHNGVKAKHKEIWLRGLGAGCSWLAASTVLSLGQECPHRRFGSVSCGPKGRSRRGDSLRP